MWSSATIPGKPSVLVVDASRNLEGWEQEFMDRLFSSLKRSEVDLVTEAPVRIEETHELETHLPARFNCILFFSHAGGVGVLPAAKMRTHWEWLNTPGRMQPVLFAAVMCQRYDPEASEQILKSSQSFAPLALAPESPVTSREAGLYMLKFFTELNLHSKENISGKMAWFSHSKARELLRRRRYNGKFGARC